MNNDHHAIPSNDTPRAGVAAAALGLLTTMATGAACVGPFLAILLGIGGFGWLTQYVYLRVPASLFTAALLAFGFLRLYGRGRRSCSRSTKTLLARVLLWSATLLALAINLFEYVVMPRLG